APDKSIRERARSQLEALSGGGSTRDRFEFQLGRLLPESLEPSSLIAMGVAGGLYRVTRLFALSRFMASPGLLSRMVGPATLAGLSTFGVEAVAFPLTRRLAARALGRSQNWSGDALASDAVSSAMFL